MPEGLHNRIRMQAKRNRRSINSEIIYLLESFFEPDQINAEENLDRIRQLRSKFKGNIDEDELMKIKRDGRL